MIIIIIIIIIKRYVSHAKVIQLRDQPNVPLGRDDEYAFFFFFLKCCLFKNYIFNNKIFCFEFNKYKKSYDDYALRVYLNTTPPTRFSLFVSKKKKHQSKILLFVFVNICL